jgi:hypothetical protein
VAHAERPDRHGIVLQPTGPGEARHLPVPADLVFYLMTWHPDGKSLIAEASAKREMEAAVYRIDVETGETEPISDEGVFFSKEAKVSPDGNWYIAHVMGPGNGDVQTWGAYPTSGGDPRPIAGWTENMRVVGWTADSKRLYVLERSEPTRPGQEAPRAVYRLDPETGKKQYVRSFMVPSGLGHLDVKMMFGAAEAQWLAFSYWRELSDLYLVDGVT